MDELKKALASKKSYEVGDLVAIMAVLRSDGGCPWDREQTHESIRSDFIEEVYEAIEAIDTRDNVLMREELGDVLLQVVFHSRIAEEEGAFRFSDVVDELCRKLVVRHPHVFGMTAESEKVVTETKDGLAVADTADKVVDNWEAIKQSMKERKTLTEELCGVSKALPSLMRASKLAKKARKAGAYEPDDAFAELRADIDETDEADKAELEAAVGAQLFELAASAQLHGIDPEQALYRYCEKFIEGCKDNKN